MSQRNIVLSALGLLAAAAACAIWARRHPSACPYRYRFAVSVPRPVITRARLREILDPKPGERILEVGPGTGYYALHTAEWIEPGGTLEILDIQQEMLDHTMRLANERGLSNIAPAHGDASALPYPDDRFDAAYLVTVLGEIPKGNEALAELRRVLKPGGRLVVGELLPDPHMVPLNSLRARAEAAGLRYETHQGNRIGYFARFRAT